MRSHVERLKPALNNELVDYKLIQGPPGTEKALASGSEIKIYDGNL